MIDHEQAQELLTLRAFGEMDESEANRLALHLGSCADCRRFDQEFAQGIGRLAKLEDPPRADATPPPSVRRVGVHPAPAWRRRLAPLAACAASFAAGICVTLAIHSGSESTPTPPPPPSQRVEGTFARESPPPLATTLGVLTVMARSVPR